MSVCFLCFLSLETLASLAAYRVHFQKFISSSRTNSKNYNYLIKMVWNFNFIYKYLKMNPIYIYTCNKILACFLVDSGAKMAIKAIHLQRQLPGNLDILVLTKHFQNPFPTFLQIVQVLRRWYLRRTSIVHTSYPNNQQIGHWISEIQAFFCCLQ